VNFNPDKPVEDNNGHSKTATTVTSPTTLTPTNKRKKKFFEKCYSSDIQGKSTNKKKKYNKKHKPIILASCIEIAKLNGDQNNGERHNGQSFLCDTEIQLYIH